MGSQVHFAVLSLNVCGLNTGEGLSALVSCITEAVYWDAVFLQELSSTHDDQGKEICEYGVDGHTVYCTNEGSRRSAVILHNRWSTAKKSHIRNGPTVAVVLATQGPTESGIIFDVFSGHLALVSSYLPPRSMDENAKEDWEFAFSTLWETVESACKVTCLQPNMSFIWGMDGNCELGGLSSDAEYSWPAVGLAATGVCCGKGRELGGAL